MYTLSALMRMPSVLNINGVLSSLALATNCIAVDRLDTSSNAVYILCSIFVSSLRPAG